MQVSVTIANVELNCEFVFKPLFIDLISVISIVISNSIDIPTGKVTKTQRSAPQKLVLP
jgi:hypothetical protein